jgi:hypothetical protein
MKEFFAPGVHSAAANFGTQIEKKYHIGFFHQSGNYFPQTGIGLVGQIPN